MGVSVAKISACAVVALSSTCFSLVPSRPFRNNLPSARLDATEIGEISIPFAPQTLTHHHHPALHPPASAEATPASAEATESVYLEAMARLSSPIPTFGMPWTRSVSKKDDPLLYMPFWEWQLQFMEENLTDLRPVRIPDEFSFKENTKKKARIVNLAFRSKEYRKIRMTYYDAGAGCQVFNSLWYPEAGYDLPVLGIDLLAFGRKRHLAIVDFQPIHDQLTDDHDPSWGHEVPFEQIMSPIREKYSELQGKMSAKFYDETKFFSHKMLFSRFEKEEVVGKSLFPAYKEMVEAHVSMMKNSVPSGTDARRKHILERQSAYDTYSAERDPATGLFATMFGRDWADKFVYDYLFSSSRPEPGVMAGSKAKVHGPPQGGPPGGGGPPAGTQGAPQLTAINASQKRNP